MKGTIVTPPADGKLGVIKDNETGDTGDFCAGYFEKVAAGDQFRYRSIVQTLDGEKEKMLYILKKRIPK
jgi:hypothetical protein